VNNTQKLPAMTAKIPLGNISLRPATQADAGTIRAIISQVKINPLALDWHRFILATDLEGRVIGCGQVKPHHDGTFELASIAVLPNWRNKGIARMIIDHLLLQNPGTIYLTCQSTLDSMYQNFGFKAISPEEMTPYFRRLYRIVTWVGRLTLQSHTMLVMRRN
jgi:N-acetylglutamate synthase-like GNAT family acetyltransferase